jgi:hypothetical protein
MSQLAISLYKMRQAGKKSSDVVPDLGRRVREMIATKVIRTTPIKSPNSTRGRQSRDREGSRLKVKDTVSGRVLIRGVDPKPLSEILGQGLGEVMVKRIPLSCRDRKAWRQ